MKLGKDDDSSHEDQKLTLHTITNMAIVILEIILNHHFTSKTWHTAHSAASLLYCYLY